MGFFEDVANELPEVRQYLGGQQDQNSPAVGADGWAMSNPGQFPQSQKPVQTPAQPSAPSMSREAYRDAWMGSGAASMADLQKFIAANGGQLLDGAGRVKTPYGEVIDMGINARGSADGKGQMRAGWGATGADAVAVDRAAREASGGGNLSGGGMSLGEGMQGGGNFSSASMSMSRPQWTGGDFAYDGARPEGFKGITAADMAADPGYQFRLQEGQKAIENSRLAAGIGRTGDTAKELLNYGQQAASQEFGNVYGRKAAEHQSSLGAQMQDFGQRHTAWTGNVNAALGHGNLSLGHKQADNAYSLGQGQLSLGQGQLGLAQSDQSFQQGVMFPWQQQSTLAQMGMQAAQNAGAYGANYGQQQGNAYYGSGNAQAGAAVAGGNAWNNAYSGIANAAQDAWSQFYANKPKPKPRPTGGG